MWLDPQPAPESLPALYAGYCAPVQPKPQTLARSLWQSARRGVLAAAYGYRERAGAAESCFWHLVSAALPVKDVIGGTVQFVDGSRKGRLLDVGCGSGEFLATMKSLGWTVEGVEFNPEAARLAREAGGAPVFAGSLEDARLEDSSFDVVTLHHVIEHLPDPARTLAECRRILKDGGRIHILTPNADSLGLRIFRRHWQALEVPRHLRIYSSESIRKILAPAGFEIRILRSTPRSAWLAWTASRWLSRNDRLDRPVSSGLWTAFEGLLFHCVEHLLCLFRDCGEEILAVGVVKKT